MVVGRDAIACGNRYCYCYCYGLLILEAQASVVSHVSSALSTFDLRHGCREGCHRVRQSLLLLLLLRATDPGGASIRCSTREQRLIDVRLAPRL